jgi:hypothetical protein
VSAVAGKEQAMGEREGTAMDGEQQGALGPGGEGEGR